MPDQSVADDAACTGDDGKDAVRNARFQRQLRQTDRCQWCLIRRFENDDISHRQSRRTLPGGDRDRKVPWNDDAADAEWFAEGHQYARGGARNRLA